MARFLPEYREIDTRPLWEKIAVMATWVLLILLVPGTVLGYFAEKSYPGQVLYPMKRGIEQMVLLVESVAPYSRSSYLQTLANTRIQETNDLIAYSGSSANIPTLGNESLSNVVFSVQEAESAIAQIQDPQARMKAREQLATSIQSYKSQLTQINYTIQKNLISNPTSTPNPLSPTNIPTPTSVNAQTPTPASDLAGLGNQINTVVQQLDQINSTLSATIPLPSPTPTSVPTIIIPTATPSPLPTSTPTPISQRHGDND